MIPDYTLHPHPFLLCTCSCLVSHSRPSLSPACFIKLPYLHYIIGINQPLLGTLASLNIHLQLKQPILGVNSYFIGLLFKSFLIKLISDQQELLRSTFLCITHVAWHVKWVQHIFVNVVCFAQVFIIPSRTISKKLIDRCTEQYPLFRTATPGYF